MKWFNTSLAIMMAAGSLYAAEIPQVFTFSNIAAAASSGTGTVAFVANPKRVAVDFSWQALSGSTTGFYLVPTNSNFGTAKGFFVPLNLMNVTNPVQSIRFGVDKIGYGKLYIMPYPITNALTMDAVESARQ